MGLAIAARAVAVHGGAIEASNLAGGGLAVCIELPLLKPVVPAAATPAAVAPASLIKPAVTAEVSTAD